MGKTSLICNKIILYFKIFIRSFKLGSGMFDILQETSEYQ